MQDTLVNKRNPNNDIHIFVGRDAVLLARKISTFCTSAPAPRSCYRNFGGPMDTKVVPAYIEQMHEHGKLSDDEYRLIALAMKIKACRLRSDTVESGKDRCSVRFEITFLKDMKLPEGK